MMDTKSAYLVSRTFKVLLLIGLLLSAQTANAQKGKYNKACKLNTEQAYMEFLKLNPESKYAEDVTNRLSAIIFISVKQRNTINDYQEFISEYPKSDSVQVAEARLNKLLDSEFAKIKSLNTINNYKEFIDKYPENTNTNEAKKLLDELEYLEVKEVNTVDAYEAFIAQYPQSENNKKAKEKIEELKYLFALEKNSYKLFEAFINDFPNSKHLEEITRLRDIAKNSSYYVNQNNYRKVSSQLRSKYPEAYEVFLDGLLNKTGMGSGSQPDKEKSKIAGSQLRQIHSRPITSSNYEILNMLGCWIRLASDKASMRTFESAFSGSFFLNFIFTYYSPVVIDGEEKLAGLFFLSDEERASNETEIVTYKLALIDMFEDIYQEKTKDKVCPRLKSIIEHEKNIEVLERAQNLLLKCE